MKQKTTLLFIFFVILTSINFYQARFIPESLIKTLNFVGASISIMLGGRYFLMKRSGFVAPVQLICISAVISMVMALLVWDQDLLSSAKSTFPFLIWMLFFFLLKKNIPVSTLESAVLFFGVLYGVLFFFQFANTRTVYFGLQEEFVLDRGVVRVNFPGAGMFFLSVYIALVRFTDKKRSKLIWGSLIVAGAVVTVLQVTRQTILALLIMYLLHFLTNVSFWKKAITVVIFASIGYYALNSNNAIIKGLSEVQKQTTMQGEQYIRVMAAQYFLQEFSKTDASVLFGNGVAYGNKSPLGKEILKLKGRGFYLSDIGLIGIYIMYGIICVIAYGMLFWQSMTTTLPANLAYVKYYIWTVMLTSLTSDSLYGDKFLISTVLAIYIFQKYGNKISQDMQKRRSSKVYAT